MIGVHAFAVTDADLRFNVFGWSQWIDVSIVDRNGHAYLLQMTVNKRGRKRFKTTFLEFIPIEEISKIGRS